MSPESSTVNEFFICVLQGIGRRFSTVACKKADIDMNKRAGELSEEEVRVELVLDLVCVNQTDGV